MENTQNQIKIKIIQSFTPDMSLTFSQEDMLYVIPNEIDYGLVTRLYFYKNIPSDLYLNATKGPFTWCGYSIRYPDQTQSVDLTSQNWSEMPEGSVITAHYRQTHSYVTH